MSLQVSPKLLEWDALSYSVTTSKGPPWNKTKTPKTILSKQFGFAEPGQLLAILGPTGRAS